MEKIIAIGPYTDSMKASLARHLPAEMSLDYITDYTQYGATEDADYLILRTLKLQREHIEKLQRAKLIQRWGAGFDTVDIAAAGKKGIKVAVCAGVNAQSVAELAVLMMLALYRRLSEQVSAYVKGEDRRMEFAGDARCISGKTVGVFGMGNIGRRVARIVRGFGAEVVYYDVFRQSEQTERELGIRFASIDELLAASDIVSLHLPATEETKDFIRASTIEKMKPGAMLINAARWELVNERDLADAVACGRLRGAGLDDIAEPVAQSPFAGMERVLCTPHIGGSTLDINDAMAEACMQHIAAVRAGESFSGLVNGEYLK